MNTLIHNGKLKHTLTRTEQEWFQDEYFWKEFAPFMFDEARWAMADTEVAQILVLSGVEPPAKVLDLCCGVGRHSLAFARRGCTVTGVDITAGYLEAAKESAAAEGLTIEFIHEDARAFRRTGEFALCINLGASFGYCSNADDDALMLRRCRENLASGGIFVLETMGKETAARTFVESETVDRNGWTVSARYSVIGDWEKLGNAWSAQKGDTIYERSFAIRLYAGTELRALLLREGFGSIVLYGDFEGHPYDQDAQMLVAVARKTAHGLPGRHTQQRGDMHR